MKLVLTALVTVLAVLAYKLMAPWVALEAQQIIANQMNNTDSSTVLVQYVGNGTALLSRVLLAAWLLGMVLIWASTVVRKLKQLKSPDTL